MRVEYNDYVVQEQRRCSKLQQLQGDQVSMLHYENLGESGANEGEEGCIYFR